jgi:hypothetical protein
VTLHTLLVAGSVLLASLQLVYNWLLKDHRRAGWALVVFVNVIGLPYDWFTAQYGYLALTALNLPVAVRAWREWGQDGSAAPGLAAERERAEQARLIAEYENLIAWTTPGGGNA